MHKSAIWVHIQAPYFDKALFKVYVLRMLFDVGINLIKSRYYSSRTTLKKTACSRCVRTYAISSGFRLRTLFCTFCVLKIRRHSYYVSTSTSIHKVKSTESHVIYIGCGCCSADVTILQCFDLKLFV